MCVPPSGLRQRHGGDQLARLAARSRCAACRRAGGGTRRSGCARVAPSGVTVSTVASSTRMATAMSLGMGGDAGVARRRSTASWRLKPPMRRAAAAGLALVAGLGGVVEIRAARALQQVAGRGRLVAQLAGGAGEQRPRQHAVVAPHARVGREVGVAHQRADAQAALRRRLDRVERQAVDVDRCAGVSICSFIRSRRLVPPAMNFAPGVRATAAAASAGRARRARR